MKWQMSIPRRQMGWRHKAAHVLLRAVAVLLTRVPGSLSYGPALKYYCDMLWACMAISI